MAAPVSLQFLPGKATHAWAYHDGAAPKATGTVPGPRLELNQGDHVMVHFRNDLPDPTTIHWHGLRVPNASDGTPVAQIPVEPGATYDYEFDATDAGLFWFHPHVASDVQIERGLYAPVLVRQADEPEVTTERVLVLDDVKIEANGELSTETDALDVMLGRQGNVLLVNGKRAPTLTARAGSLERWRFVNVANGRYFNLAVPGRSLRVIGGDGGLVPEPYDAETLLIAPGERQDVLVDIGGAPGDVLRLQTVYYDRGHDIPDVGPLDLLQVEVDQPAAPRLPLPDTRSDFVPLQVGDATPIVHLVLSEDESSSEPRFLINGEEYPNATPTQGAPGDIAIWEIQNDSEMDHPFHLHGMFFQVLDIGGVVTQHGGWKDTVNVPLKETLRFAVQYGDAGRWMYHCHILEHAERGMMGELVLAGE
ncbi:MAG TPA: multicopper oxidase family protein [Polyangiaceae bacterium]|nr:multicopper oxidase family protein [Polyangiaceae bacterium]